MDAATMKALRETVGMSVSTLARLARVQERTVRRWETGAAPVPEDVAEIVERAKERQDVAVYTAMQVYDDAIDELPDGSELSVDLRYWTSQAEYLEHSTDAALGLAGDWMMANATTRRVAAMLDSEGVAVRYTSDELPRPRGLTLVD